MNRTINISIPDKLLEEARLQVKKGYFSSVSEIVRSALREFFKNLTLTLEKTTDQDPLLEWRRIHSKEFNGIDSVKIIRRMRSER